MGYIDHVLALLLAVICDKIWGDPQWMPHPVVFFGKVIHWGEQRMNRGKFRRLKGGLMVTVFVSLCFIACYFFMQWATIYSFPGVVVEALMIFFCLAGTTLIRECRAVFKVLESQGVEAGRVQVGRIVGRNTARLDEQEIKTAALETLAENLSDGVIAPLFWYALLGIPGMMTYKLINTFDSMIGYRNTRYGQFGTVAARLDDVVNWIPARITAVLMACCSAERRPWIFILRYGHAHASPNAGFPEAALAGVLNCRFGGTHDYGDTTIVKPVIGEIPCDFSMNHLRRAITINQGSEYVMILLVIVAGFLKTWI